MGRTAVLVQQSPSNHQYSNAKVVQVSLLKRSLAGGFAGGCSTVIGHPFDTIKVRLQTEDNLAGNTTKNGMSQKARQRRGRFSRPHSNNFLRTTFSCAIKILRYEGMRGFYKGLLFPMVSGVPWCAATFYGYSLGERMFETKIPQGQFSNQKVIVSGFLAGVFNATIACPIERVKCLLQVQQNGGLDSTVKYKGPFHCARQIYLEGGFLHGYFKGYCVSLLRRGPGYAIHFFVYENIKRLFRERNKRSDVTGVEMLIAGGSAGLASCLYWIAPDTIKSRIQTASSGQYPHGIRSVIREMRLRGEGFSTLYRGLPPVMIRAVPTNGVYMFTYEYLLKLLV